MKAWELLSDESKWTKGYNARDKDGKVVAISDKAATCWCTIGSIFKAYNEVDELSYREKFGPFWHRICERIKDFPDVKDRGHNYPCNGPTDVNIIIGWNDAKERTYEEVYSVLKELDI